jgi:hypothetical protein
MCFYIMIQSCIMVMRYVDVVCSLHLVPDLLPLLPLFCKLEMRETLCPCVRNHDASCHLDPCDKE